MVDEIFNEAKSRMIKAIEHCMHEMSQIIGIIQADCTIVYHLQILNLCAE